MATDRGPWTLPNLISAGRLACVPVFLWLLWSQARPVAAAVLLGALGATDWVDGWIARRFDQGSELGKVLDPVADRVLLLAAAVALIVENLSTAVTALAIVVLVREVVIAGATLALAAAGARRIDVIWAGKAGTLSVMFSLPCLLAAANLDGVGHALLLAAGWLFAAAGVGFGWYAVAQYVPAARVALREGRDGRAGRSAGEVRAGGLDVGTEVRA
jgi:cardiolipin synthase